MHFYLFLSVSDSISYFRLINFDSYKKTSYLSKKIHKMKKILLLFVVLMSNLISFAQNLEIEKGEFLISFKRNASKEKFSERLKSFEGLATNLKINECVAPQMNIWSVTFDAQNIDEDFFLEYVRRQDEVNVAQFNHILTKRGTTPNDSLLAKQWQWINTGQTAGTADADVDAELAWDITKGGYTAIGDTIVVAVIDDGTSLNHPDLKANTWHNNYEIPKNGIDDDGNGYIDDYNGWNTTSNDDNVDNGSHGINVFGMIGAVGNNKTGVVGMNWNIKVMSIRPIKTDEKGVIAGYSYALANRQLYEKTKGKKGAFVVVTNSSWGIDNGKPIDAPLWCGFYDTLGYYGILSCGATANNNVDIDVVGDLPTGCESDFLISVTASNNKDVRTFSAKGKKGVDLAAPGDQIYTTAGPNGYTTTSGTSFASPLVAGVVGLMYSAPCSNLANLSHKSPAEAALLVKKYLLEGVDKKSNLTDECVTGGRVNAYNALDLLMKSCGPCPSPSNLSVKNITTTAASLNFTVSDSSKMAILEWKQKDSTTWKIVQKATSPIQLSNLKECTQYSFRVKSVCKDSTSSYSNVVTFKTDGCCEPPASLKATLVSDQSVTFTWPMVIAAKSYQIQFRKVGAAKWISFNPTNPKVDTLSKCTTYEAKIRTICIKDTTAFTALTTFKTTGCGACLDVPYCKATANDMNTFEYIKIVKLNTLTNTTTANSKGYNDFTTKVGKTTDLTTGSSYNISLTPGYSGSTFPEYFKVWIDWNQDGNFDDTDVAFDAGMSDTKAVSGFVNVPLSSKLGSTRMRVAMKFGSTAPDPCDATNFGYGEVEDYCVNIKTNFVPCAKSTTVKAIIPSVNALKVVWAKVDSAIAYNVIYKKLGAPDATFSIENAVDTTYTINKLLPCTEYEVQVRSICKNDFSAFTPSTVSKTDCSNPTKDLNIVAGMKVSPNPFDQNLALDFYVIEDQAVKIELLSTAGQVLFSVPKQYFNVGQQHLNLEIDNQLPKGFYFLKLSNEKGMKIQKIVKQ